MYHKERKIIMDNLNDLLKHDEKAKKYFMSLSEELQGGMTLKSDSIHSYSDMIEFAKNHLSEN